jgi:N-methylhydantoinase A/oxoprolinase/acetone carboxylase beta subunit
MSAGGRGAGVHDYALGIDTGGTYTDGVLWDLSGGGVLAKTKVITTRHDLSLAVRGCLDDLLRKRGVDGAVLENLRMVCLSTTLATNAIVEGQGAEVGLLLIGHLLDREVPTSHVAELSGGCDIKGKILRPLDREEVRRAVLGMQGRVEAFAVSGYMSVRNPEQELAARDLARELTGLPAVCAHQLSADLGVYERTVTSVLNARLIPLITRLIDAVRGCLASRSIRAPIMVVKGDGSLISERTAMERPVETVLSGPAASMVGATVLSGETDGLVVDIGGTTTDTALIREGDPSLSRAGAMVGGWRTRVRAADITTAGLGGDSFIRVSRDGALAIGPQKVFPLSWICSLHPHLLEELREVRDSGFDPVRAQPTCIFVHVADPSGIRLTGTEQGILDAVRERPHSLRRVAGLLGKDPNILGWERLVTMGAVHRANLTPTDMLHVTGKFQAWDQEAARLGADLLARRMGMETGPFVQRFFRQYSYRLFVHVVGTLCPGAYGEPGSGSGRSGMTGGEQGAAAYFLQRMFEEGEEESLPVRFSARALVPVVAVGAPATAYLPDVARRLGARLVVPEHAEVANAVGTVNGKVVERVQILIKPGETGGFFVYTPEERRIFIRLEEALSFAEGWGTEYARRLAEDSGAHRVRTSVRRMDRNSALSGGEERDSLFIESVLQVSAVGDPWER